MATHHGTITEFSGNSDDWEAYSYRTIGKLFRG